MNPGNRKHTIDLGVWEGDDAAHRVLLILDEARLDAAACEAIARHDQTKKLAGGAIVLKAERIAAASGSPTPKEPSHGTPG